MAGFTIPNESDAAFSHQAKLDSGDLAILAAALAGTADATGTVDASITAPATLTASITGTSTVTGTVLTAPTHWPFTNQAQWGTAPTTHWPASTLANRW